MEEGKNTMLDRTQKRTRDFALVRHDDEKRKKTTTTTTTKNKDFTMNLNDDMVFTLILSKLLTKSLMRFKSVCKPWKSTMEQDSHFLNSHRIRSQAQPPRLLTIVRNFSQRRSEKTASFDLYSSDLDCGDGAHYVGRGARYVRRSTVGSVKRVRIPGAGHVDVLGPVKGLICFIDTDNFDVMVYNPTTGQHVAPWCRSKVWTTRKCARRQLVRGFGIDPITGQPKVILVWHASCPPACEVLTVGVDNPSWRIIDALPPTCEFETHLSTYAGGSIYYMFYTSTNNQYNLPPDLQYYNYLVAFDIGSEKFRMMSIPRLFSKASYARELDGCLTMVLNLPKRRLLWKFHDRNKETTSSTSTDVVRTSVGRDWSHFCIEMPSCISPEAYVLYHPIPGKDHMMILETYDRTGDIRNAFQVPAQFYCYNRIDKSLISKFEIQGIPYLPGHNRNQYAVYVEDLFPCC
ncbi:Putative F-box protein At1g32420 [Linum grandiflorum]